MHALRRIFIAAVLAGSSLSPLSADAVYSPAGSEFQVNSYTLDDQSLASIAADADGDFVVVWLSQFQDYGNTGVFAQRFANDGSPSGTEFQVDSIMPPLPFFQPAVAADADGDFVVVWTSFYIFGQRFDSSGTALGGAFQVNSFTTGNFYSLPFDPDVASDADGDFVVAWVSVTQDGNVGGVFGQRFASSGAALGSEFQVNSYTNFYQFDPQVASDADGDFVVVWTSYQDGGGTGVFGQRFASDGSPSGTEFQINSYTLSYQGAPGVAADADGDFVVVWDSYAVQDGSLLAAMGQRFDSTGAPAGTEFVVNAYTIGPQENPKVAMDEDGDFAVTWTSFGQDGSVAGQFVRRFDSSGSADGSELQVNTYTTNGQFLASIASSAEGDFVVVWGSDSQDGFGYGVFGQRFDVPTTPTATPTATDTPAPTTPSPTNTPTATPVGACPLTVDGGCTTGFSKGTLLVKEDVPGHEKLIVKIGDGPALTQTDMGNPLSGGGTVYSVCIYDDGGNLAGGIGSSVIVDRAGDDCGGIACWKAIGDDPPNGKGYKYKDAALAADGVQKLLYKGGDAGRSKAIVKGKGANLPDGIPATLQSATFATVQLRASDAQCLSVAVDDIKKQTAGYFRAKFAAP